MGYLYDVIVIRVRASGRRRAAFYLISISIQARGGRTFLRHISRRHDIRVGRPDPAAKEDRRGPGLRQKALYRWNWPPSICATSVKVASTAQSSFDFRQFPRRRTYDVYKSSLEKRHFLRASRCIFKYIHRVQIKIFLLQILSYFLYLINHLNRCFTLLIVYRILYFSTHRLTELQDTQLFSLTEYLIVG